MIWVEKPIQKWHRHFVWFPVRITPRLNQCQAIHAWFEWVERRWISFDFYYEIPAHWKYRLVEPITGVGEE